MNLKGVYQLKSIYYDGVEFKTSRFGIFETLEDAKAAINDIYKDDGDRIIIDFVPFGLSKKFPSKVLFDKIFKEED